MIFIFLLTILYANSIISADLFGSAACALLFGTSSINNNIKILENHYDHPGKTPSDPVVHPYFYFYLIQLRKGILRFRSKVVEIPFIFMKKRLL